MSNIITSVKSLFTSGSAKASASTTKATSLVGTSSSGMTRGNGNFKNAFRPFGGLDSCEFDPFIGGYTYVFMTAPRMVTQKDAYITMIQQSTFVPIITNLVKGFPENDYSTTTQEAWATYAGKNIVYGDGLTTEYNVDFTLVYNETQDALITRIHKSWLNYIYEAKMGRLVREYTSLHNNILDYAVAFYVIHTQPDGKTINYWAKYTGAIPFGLGVGNLGLDNKQSHDVQTMSVTYKAAVREILTKEIIQDFVELTGMTTGNVAGLIDPDVSVKRPVTSGIGSAQYNSTDPGLAWAAYTSPKIVADPKGNLQLIFI